MDKSIHRADFKHLATWLKQCREERGYTMREFGDIIDRHHSIIGKIESCERRLDVIEYMDYCEALGVNPLDGIKVLQKFRRRK